MKTPNNNKKIINKLVFSYLKANKKRNYFAIIGIILTCIMFTGISTAVLTMTDAVEQEFIALVGGDYHGSIKEVDFKTGELFQKHKSIKDSYLSINIDDFKENEFEKLPTEFKYISFDSDFYTNINSYTGTPAKNYNEIVVSPNVLKLLDKSVEIGEVITLEYTVVDESFTEDFIVTGITKDNDIIEIGFIYVSEIFMEQHIKNNDKITLEYLRSDKNINSRIDLVINFDNKFNIMKKLETVIEDSGFIPLDEINIENYKLRQDTNYFRYNANPVYTSNMNFDILSLLAVFISCLLVMISGYLIINNIFTISVLRDINYYGQLKTIGATSKQIKQIIIRQAMYLSFIGMPIGLILGLGIGNIMVKAIISGTNISLVEVDNFDYRIYIISIIFVMITVYLSLLKPSKIVNRLSPIETLRYTNKQDNIKINKKINYNKKVTTFTFAIRNLKSQKFTTLKVLFGIALCPIILNTVYSFSNGYLNEEDYINDFSPSNFMIASNKYFNTDYRGEDGILSEKSVDFVKNLDMVDEENQGGIYTFMYDEKSAKVDVENKVENLEVDILFGVDKFALSKYDVVFGEIDYDKYMSGDYIIYIGFFDDNDEYLSKEKHSYVNHFYPKDKVNLTINNIQKEYEIMAVVKPKYSLGLRYSLIDPPYDDFILPVDELKSLTNKVYLMSYLFDVDDEHLYEVEKIMSEYKDTNEERTRYQSNIGIMQKASNAKKSVLIPGVIIAIIIGMISIINLINLIISSILAREKEFAIMESIGMTKSMKKNIILYEGFLYALFASIIFVILGIIVDIFLVQSMTSVVAYPNYHFSLTLLLICVPICFIVLYVITLVLYNLNNNKSIIEKLRAQ